MPDLPAKHGRDHGARAPDPVVLPYLLHVQVFADLVAVATGDGKRTFEIPRALDGCWLTEVESYVVTAGGSATTVQLRNKTTAHDILSTKVTVDSGELNSKDAATQPDISNTTSQVAWGDHIAVDVDAAGSGALGLALWLTFEYDVDPSRV